MRSLIWTALVVTAYAQAQAIVTVCESYNYTATSTFTEYETFHVVDGSGGIRPVNSTSPNTRSSTGTKNNGGSSTSDGVSDGGIGNSRTTVLSTTRSITTANVPGNGTSVVIPDNTIAPPSPIPTSSETTTSIFVSSASSLSTSNSGAISSSISTTSSSVFRASSLVSSSASTVATVQLPSLSSSSTLVSASTSALAASTSVSTSVTTSSSTLNASSSPTTRSTTLTTTTSIASSTRPSTTTTKVISSTVSRPPSTTSYASSTQIPAASSSSISSSTSTSVAPVVTNKAYIDTILRHHNQHRLNHTSDPLVWNSTLAETAKKIANSCVYQHDTATDCPPDGSSCYGQNIAAGYLSTQMSFLVSDGFYNSEVNSYTYYGGEPADGTLHEWGHFSQIVWKIDTFSVGCYTMDCSGRSGGLTFPGGGGAGVRPVFTVCNYGGPGNWVGEFKENVIKPIGLPSIHAGYKCPSLENCEDA